jgi:hypothetical protein
MCSHHFQENLTGAGRDGKRLAKYTCKLAGSVFVLLTKKAFAGIVSLDWTLDIPVPLVLPRHHCVTRFFKWHGATSCEGERLWSNRGYPWWIIALRRVSDFCG